MRMRSRRGFLLFVILLSVTVFSWALEKEPPSVFGSRRDNLRRMTEGGVVVLFGFTGREPQFDLPAARFWQEPNFYYLTGWNEPGAGMLLAAESEATRAAGLNKEMLFVPPRDRGRERWDGIRSGPDDADVARKSGFQTVLPFSELSGQLEKYLKLFPIVYTLFPASGPAGEFSPNRRWLEWLQKVAPGPEYRNLTAIIGNLRQVKSPGEEAFLRKAIEASMDAHLAAMKAVRPGAWEYEIAALMEYTFKKAGCEQPAYTPIVGSGFNSTVLHYAEAERQMKDGELLVLDVAGAYSGYAADITRTLPVNGKFSPRQREIYEIVLGAQNAVLAAVKPGMSLGRAGDKSLHKIAYDYINSHGKDLHGDPLGKYFIHGLGHHIGLDVHDAGEPTRPLEAGMIITIEPGIYISEENLGVRIEDDVLVTKDGAVLLTARLPRHPDEIEKIMAAARKAGKQPDP
ncbi:MAG TPA: aminopeptidase P family protein [Candidatus Acidoferrales bacterium]